MDLRRQREWLRRVLGQAGGFASYLEHELSTDITFEMMNVEDEAEALGVLEDACAFVLRCLANPACEGSGEVVEALLRKRAGSLDKDGP